MNPFHTVLAATLVLSSAAAPARAAGDSDTSTVQVSYADLNLSSKAGVDTLRHRLIAASRAVCGAPDVRDTAGTSYTAVCRDSALQDALHDLRQVVASAQSAHAAVLASAAPN